MILPEDRTLSHCPIAVGSIAGSKRDDTYFWDMVTFSVEGSLFRVPRYQFIVGSQYFYAAYLNAPSNPLLTLDDLASNDGRSQYSEEYEEVEAPGGSTPTAIDTPSVNREPWCERAVALEGVTSEQFRTFLKLLFPIHLTSTTVTLTKPEWSSILTLSTLWHFNHLRALAIHHLDQPSIDPIELILVGRSNFVTEWVLRGYEALVLKDEAIEEDESEMIGDKTSVKLYIIRHGLARRLKEHAEHEAQVAFVRDQFAKRFGAEESEQGGGEQIGKGQVEDGNGEEAGANITQLESKPGEGEKESGIKGEVRADGEDGVNKEEITIGKKHAASTTSEIKEVSTEEDERQRLRQEKLERKRERKENRAERRRQEEDKRKEEESQAPDPKEDSSRGLTAEGEQENRKKAEELREQAVLEELHRVQKELYCIDAEKQKAQAREERRRRLAKIEDQEKKRLQQEAEEARKKEELEVLKRQWKAQEMEAPKLPGAAAVQSLVGLLPGWK
ncbi:hypothetical protein H1R20_g12561, partial [Candolleomyces eurysporus]